MLALKACACQPAYAAPPERITRSAIPTHARTRWTTFMGFPFRISAAKTIRISPRPFEGQTPSVGRDELMDHVGPPRSGGIDANGRRGLQQGSRLFPQSLDALGGREKRVIAAHRIENEALISLEHVADEARVVHGKLQAQLVESHS